MPRSNSQNFCCQCPCPHHEPQPPSVSAGDPPTLASRSGSVSYEVTAPSSWVLLHTLLSVCPPRVESLFPPVLSKSCNQIVLIFKVWFSGNSSSRCQAPRLGSLTWGSEPSLQWADFCGIIVLQFVSPTQWFLDLILLWLCPSYCLIAASPLSLDVGYLFGEFQCLPVNDCSAVSCDSSALARGSRVLLYLNPIYWTGGQEAIWYRSSGVVHVSQKPMRHLQAQGD